MISVLGRPDRQFEKAEQRSRGGGGVPTPGGPPPPDYILNYFDDGVDVVINGATHTVRKVVLHTNAPGYVGFAVVTGR